MTNAAFMKHQEKKLQNALDAQTCAVVEFLDCLSSIGGRAEIKINRFVKELKENGESNPSRL